MPRGLSVLETQARIPKLELCTPSLLIKTRGFPVPGDWRRFLIYEVAFGVDIPRVIERMTKAYQRYHSQRSDKCRPSYEKGSTYSATLEQRRSDIQLCYPILSRAVIRR